MITAPHDHFLALHERLAILHPDAILEAKALAATTVDPKTATPDEIWRVLWDKPLYANARVDVAKRWVANINDDMNGAWRILGADPAVFTIRQTRPGIQRDCFEVQGEAAKDFVTRQSVALHRLYRIQGAAKALRARALRHAHPLANIVGRPLSEVIPILQAEFGPGWGAITVLHALTDMGLAVKPDLHLVNTMRVLGLCKGMSDRKVPDFRDAIRINDAVRQLLAAIGQTDSPSNLRYIDKVLMDVSHRNVLSKPLGHEPGMSLARTSLSHPIRVDALPMANGLLGLTFCPGKKDTSLSGAQWDRDLDNDLSLFRAWGAGLVITLMERPEFDLLGVPSLPDRIRDHGMDWAHLPIVDQGVPDPAFLSAWPQVQADAFARLNRGGRVILHCRGGLGRTGLVATLLLIETGSDPAAAIRLVRQVRPGAIETAAQERFIHTYVSRDHREAVSAQFQRTGQIMPGYLQTMRDNHITYGHLKMAADIAADLRAQFPALKIEGPGDWEGGRYVAVFVTLVPGRVRMIIQLTDSGRDQHVYNLKPQSDDKADVEQFGTFMQARYPQIALRNHGQYAKLPAWTGLKLDNLDHDAIGEQVQYALNFFGETVSAGATA